MRRRILVVIGLLIPLFGMGQNSSVLKDAQGLFAAGNYSAAVTKYQEAVNTLSGRERAIAQLQMSTAKNCVEAINNAKAAESKGDYDTAISEYQKVVDANPSDTKVKGLQEAAQKSKREANPSLSVSLASLNFPSSGGTQKIIVNCSMSWSLVDQSSSMCTVSRSGNELSITCNPNSGYQSRNASLIVKTTNGVKKQTITITQLGKSSSSSGGSSSYATYLKLSKTNISASNVKGSAIIDVKTDASDYSISLLPSWCTVKSKYKTWFSIEYTANPNYTARSDWFNVTAGGKTVKVTITQDPKNSSYSSSSTSVGNSSSSSLSGYSHHQDKIFRVGLDASMDIFTGSNSSYSYEVPISGGLGLRARIGRYNQLFNFIGGARYVFGKNYNGLMVPVLLNLNLFRLDGVAMYFGGGYEFGFLGTYTGDGMLQMGICGKHYDLNMYYKPEHVVLGFGFTYYF